MHALAVEIAKIVMVQLQREFLEILVPAVNTEEEVLVNALFAKGEAGLKSNRKIETNAVLF